MATAIARPATPMMEQILKLKAEAGDALLLVRMGDFYESFFDDAAAVAGILDIALTHRGEHAGKPVPMCGVPVHAQEAYLARLVKAGRSVAIAEQMEEPAAARKRGSKAIVERAIVRVLTPGTLTEERLLESRARSLLASAFPAGERAGLAWADVATGLFVAGEVPAEALADELARLAPAETLVPEGAGLAGTALAATDFDSLAGGQALAARFGDGGDFEAAFGRPALAAIAALLAHVGRTARGAPVRLLAPARFAPEAAMAIDAATRASLDLLKGPQGSREGSLLATIDCCVTAEGARLLADELASPLTDGRDINRRLDLVEAFLADTPRREGTRTILRKAPDIARALARLAAGRGRPTDLAALRDGLAAAGDLARALADAGPLAALAAALVPPADLLSRLFAALVERPPADAAAGGAIREGLDPELDALRALAADSRAAIAALEAELRTRTGVPLRIRHNGILGYHVEVATRHAGPLLDDPGFRHRQTLGTAMRFDTEALRDFATRIADAAERALAAEAAHLEALTAASLSAADAITQVARALAEADRSAALATLAGSRNWVRPEITEGADFSIRDGRHPVVEAALLARGEHFVPNDCRLEDPERVWLVTGPNMGGKSTFLRQNALIAILAQAGSFVPAAAARIGIVDRLFSRVGASDSLAEGRSTFMVEMVETAAILKNATGRSLVLLDEVGRGTATWDGLALAWAILEAIHDRGARTLFATHYHELTGLRGRLASLALRTTSAKQWEGRLVFLHRLVEGAAPGSFGLEVARIAGVPDAVLARARDVLRRLEEGEVGKGAAEALAGLPLFSAAPRPAPPEDPLRARLADVHPDLLSPRDALDLVYELKRLLRAAPTGR
ncbi:MAG: DNA mismatch repair protein MutS [Sphingomonadaceae bacterium]